MKKVLPALIVIVLMLSAGLSFAEAKHLRPLEFTTGSYDPDNGEFWFDAYVQDGSAGDSFIMNLYLEDRYSLADVDALEPDDIIEINGKTYTVEAVVIHGSYDSDDDGDPDSGTAAVRDPELVQYLLDKYETVVSTQELIPESYEIYYKEEYEGTIGLRIGKDGYCHPVFDDETSRTKIGTTEIHLPLPDGFAFHYEENWEEDLADRTAQDFLDGLNSFDRRNTVARFEDGKLVEVWAYR